MAALLDILIPDLKIKCVLLIFISILLLDHLLRLNEVDKSLQLLEVVLPHSILLLLNFNLIPELSDVVLAHVALLDYLLCLQNLTLFGLEFGNSTILAHFVKLSLLCLWRHNIWKRSHLTLYALLVSYLTRVLKYRLACLILSS